MGERGIGVDRCLRTVGSSGSATHQLVVDPIQGYSNLLDFLKDRAFTSTKSGAIIILGADGDDKKAEAKTL